MPRSKQQQPLSDDIARMTPAECGAEEQRMKESGEFEHAIAERDRWQAVADAYLSRKQQLTRRQIEVLSRRKE